MRRRAAGQRISVAVLSSVDQQPVNFLHQRGLLQDTTEGLTRVPPAEQSCGDGGQGEKRYPVPQLSSVSGLNSTGASL